MATITGTSGADTKTGTTAADTINGLGGNDKLYGRAGADTISGGDGLDSLWGEDGTDILRGDAGNDSLWGGNDGDVLYGGIDDDNMYGDAGTDTLKGEAGNDILKSGTGIGYLYGGDGNDQLYYDPTASALSTLGSYFQGSLLNGDAGTDTLNIFNKATYTSGGTTKAALTRVSVGDNDKVYVSFDSKDGYQSISMGTATSVEKITVTGNGGMEFIGNYYDWNWNSGKDVTGTTGNDTFWSFSAEDTMRGNGGNDTFHLGGWDDKVYSETNDADTFIFDYLAETSCDIIGFNGAGFQGGDVIRVSRDIITDPDSMIRESNGKTIFETNAYSIIVDKVGLVEGVDYFFM